MVFTECSCKEKYIECDYLPVLVVMIKVYTGINKINKMGLDICWPLSDNLLAIYFN